MVTEKGAKEKKHKTILQIVLLALIFVCIILTLVITLNDFNSTDDRETDSSYALPEELMGDDLSPVDQVIKETSLMLNNPDVSTEEIESYYDKVIADALESNKNDYAIEIIIQKMNYLATIKNDCVAANDYINNIDLSPYADSLKRYLSSYVVSMAIECNNQELMDEWNGRF